MLNLINLWSPWELLFDCYVWIKRKGLWIDGKNISIFNATVIEKGSLLIQALYFSLSFKHQNAKNVFFTRFLIKTIIIIDEGYETDFSQTPHFVPYELCWILYPINGLRIIYMQIHPFEWNVTRKEKIHFRRTKPVTTTFDSYIQALSSFFDKTPCTIHASSSKLSPSEIILVCATL